MADYTVNAEETSQSIILYEGDKMSVAAGGIAENTIIDYGGSAVVDGTVNATQIYSGGILFVSAGGSATGTTINPDGIMSAAKGASLENTTLAIGGSLNGFTANEKNDIAGEIKINNAEVKKGITAQLYAGQSAGMITVNGTMNVENDGTASISNVTVNNGAFLNVGNLIKADSITVAAGGTINNFTITRGEGNTYNNIAFHISSAIVSSGRTAELHSGQKATWITVASRAHVIVNDGALLTSAATNGYAHITINGGGSATRINLSDYRDYMTVNNGGVLNSANITGDYTDLYINDGGIASNVVWDAYGSGYGSDGFFVSNGGKAFNTTLRFGRMYVYNGGSATDTLVSGYSGYYYTSGAYMYISSGGRITNTVLGHLGSVELAGIAISTTLTNGGDFHIQPTGIASNTILSNGTVNVNNSGKALGVDIYGGTLNVNGSASSVTIHGGNLNLNPGGKVTNIHISSGGSVNGFTYQESRSYNSNMDLFSGTIVSKNANAFLYEGLTASRTTMDGGILRISNGGLAKETTVFSGGQIHISSGGKAANTVLSSGTLTISSGAVHGGTLYIAQGASVNVANRGYIDFTLVGRTEEDDYLINDHSLITGQISYTLTVDVGQAEGIYKLAAGAENFRGSISVRDTAGKTYGNVSINGISEIRYGGYKYILINSGDKLELRVGTRYPTIFISSASTLTKEAASLNGYTLVTGQDDHILVSSVRDKDDEGNDFFQQGNAQNVLVSSGGSMTLRTGAATSAVIYESGAVTVSSGGSAMETTIQKGGILTVSSGGSATDTAILQGGSLIISSGAFVSGAEIHSGAFLAVSSGILVEAAKVSAGGNFIISQGGISLNTVNAGNMTVNAGGTGSNTIINNGTLELQSGAVHKGTLFMEGSGSVSAAAGAVIDFSLADIVSGNTIALVNDMTRISGDVSYTITLVEGQEGRYLLAGNASSLTEGLTFTIKNRYLSSEISLGGEAVFINGYYYKLYREEGNLCFSVGDDTPPVDPIVSITPEGRTDCDVVVSVSYSEDSILRQYSYDGITWLDYEGSITVAENNTTLYFRSSDIFGLKSNIVEYTVTNILKPDRVNFYKNDILERSGKVFSGAVVGANEELDTIHINSDGIVSSLNVHSGGKAHVFAGGYAENAIVHSGGKAYVSSGGNVTGFTLSGGYAEAVSSASVNSAGIYDGTLQLRGGSGKDVTLYAYGEMIVSNGGYASNVTVNNDARLLVSNGGLLENVSVNSKGHVEILSGGKAAADAKVNEGGILDVKGYLNGATLSGSYKADGTLRVFYGGTAENVMVNYRGSLLISEGGIVNNANIITQGKMTVSSGGKAVNTVINQGGNVIVLNSGLVSSSTINNGGFLKVSSGGSATFNTVSSGGNLAISEEAFCYKTTVSAGGQVLVSSGAEARDNTISTYGAILLSDGGRTKWTWIENKGGLHVYSGGLANSTTVYSGGFLGVGNGGVANDVLMEQESKLTVWGGGNISNTTINTWAAVILSSGASANGNIIQAKGGLHVYAGATAENNTVYSDGFLGVGDGGVIRNTTIASAGELTIWGGGSAGNTVIASSGAFILKNGAVADNTVISAGGGFHVYAGAAASTVTITSGATMGLGGSVGIDPGARLINATVEYDGKLICYDGSSITGNLNIAGTVTVKGFVNAMDCRVTFDLTERAAQTGQSAGDSIIVDDISGFFGATYFITLDSETLQEGKYFLAGNAYLFNETVAISNSTTRFSLDSSVRWNDWNLSLELEEDGDLYMKAVKIGRISAASSPSWQEDSLGSWDNMETAAAAELPETEESLLSKAALALV